MILSKRAADEKVKEIKGYLWCRIDDIVQDLKHGRDEEIILKACLEVLEERKNASGNKKS